MCLRRTTLQNFAPVHFSPSPSTASTDALFILLFGWWYDADVRERFITRWDCCRPFLGEGEHRLFNVFPKTKQSQIVLFTLKIRRRHFHCWETLRCAEVLFLPITCELTDDIIITVGAILLRCAECFFPAERHMSFQPRTSPLLTSNVSVHIIVVPAVRSAKGIRVTPFLSNIRCDVIDHLRTLYARSVLSNGKCMCRGFVRNKEASFLHSLSPLQHSLLGFSPSNVVCKALRSVSLQGSCGPTGPSGRTRTHARGCRCVHRVETDLLRCCHFLCF